MNYKLELREYLVRYIAFLMVLKGINWLYIDVNEGNRIEPAYATLVATREQKKTK